MAEQLVDVQTCLCCDRCAHELVIEGQYRPCGGCGEPVTHSSIQRVQTKPKSPSRG